MALSGLKEVQRDEDLAQSVNSGGEESEGSENAPNAGNVGWANSLAKVLGTTKPKTKKTLVLSRAKKLKAGEKLDAPKAEIGFELVEGVATESAEEVKPKLSIKTELDEALTKPKNLMLPLRVKPTWKEMERERVLRKVATKGVVQLFNAVRVQQKDLQHQLDAAGKLDSRRDAVLNNIDKRKFLDVLMSGKRAKSEVVDGRVKKEERDSSSSSEDEQQEEGDERKKKRKWDVLRPDYMTNKKIKHWDEEDDDDQQHKEDSGTAESDGDDE